MHRYDDNARIRHVCKAGTWVWSACCQRVAHRDPPGFPHHRQIATSLRKKVDDTTFTLAFTDSSLREPKLGKGVVLGLEKPLAGG